MYNTNQSNNTLVLIDEPKEFILRKSPYKDTTTEFINNFVVNKKDSEGKIVATRKMTDEEAEYLRLKYAEYKLQAKQTKKDCEIVGQMREIHTVRGK